MGVRQMQLGNYFNRVLVLTKRAIAEELRVASNLAGEKDDGHMAATDCAARVVMQCTY